MKISGRSKLTASQTADPFRLLLKGELLQGDERKRKKQADAAIQHNEGVAKGAGDLLGCAFDRDGAGVGALAPLRQEQVHHKD